MAIPDDTFTGLETEIAEVVGILLEALPEEDSGIDDGVALAAGLQRYAHQVELIGAMAGSAGFSGLPEACSRFSGNLLALSARRGGLAAQERELLEEWPALVINYMEAPAEAHAEEDLIRHLGDPVWSQPLPAPDAEVLRGRLAERWAEPPVSRTVAGGPLGVADEAAEPALDAEAPVEEMAPEQAPWVEEALVASPALETTVEQAPPAPLEAPAEAGTAAPDLESASAAGELEDAAESALQEEALSDDDWAALAAASEGIVVESAAAPPQAAAQVPVAPEDTAEQAPSVWDSAASGVLEAELAVTAEPVQAGEFDLEPVAAKPLEPADLQQEVVELIGILLEALPTGATAPDSLERYTRQVERIGLAAGAAGRLGLQDVCLFFQESLLRLLAHRRELREDEWKRLEEWPTLVIGYLEAPVEPAAQALIEHLQDPVWDVPLAEEDAQVLSGLLTEYGAGEPALPAAVEEIEEIEDSGHAAEIAFEEIAAEETEAVPAEAAALPEAVAAQPEPLKALPEAAADLPEAARELMEILCLEVAQIAESAREVLTIAAAPERDAVTRSEALAGYAEQLERLAEAAEAVGLTGLHQVCVQIQANLTRLAIQQQPVTDSQRQVLEGWPEPMLAYLQALNEPGTGERLVGYLQDPRWPDPLAPPDGAALREQLTAATWRIEEPDAEARPTQAQPEDVSLELPEDVNPELLDSLLQELPQQTAEFSAAVQRLTEGEGGLQDVDVAQRIAHTLKGAGNTVGVRGVANLTHYLEDILLALSKHAVLPDRALAETLMNAADCLETMSEALVGMSAPPSQALEVLQEVLDWANRIDREGIPAAADTQALRPRPQPLSVEVEAAAGIAAPVPMLRVPAPLVDDLLRLVGESIILTGQIQERVRKTIQHTRAVQSQNRLFQQLVSELERLVDIQNVSSPLARFAQRGKFDPLELEQYNELNTVTHRLVEAAVDSQELGHNVEDNLAALDTLLIDQGRLHRDSQESVLRTRMVPVKTVVPRLQRSVRQTCRLTDKEAELTVLGADTLMDSNVLGELVDPLMHILRNSVDHGIERPELRRMLGKDPVGHIELGVVREGNTIVVRCRDDGAGLDLEAIRQTAQRKGLLGPGKIVEEDELSRFVLMPGFSTRTETTQTSGRGIGMDVVYSRLLEMKGTLHLQSKAGKGCLVEMRLPVTLISTHALLVRARDQLYAIAERGIEQLLYSGVGEIHKLGNTLTYQMGDEIYELAALADLLRLPEDRRAQQRAVPPVILVRDETGTTRAVLVDGIVDSRDLVVKPLGQYIPRLTGIVGATILGDGGVVPVLDLPELLRTPPVQGVAAAAPVKPLPQAAASRRLALVVDDSLSARRSLAQFVEDAGFEVRTARDGLEAIGIINSKPPDILLVDLEMPRMNGLELTAHIRANEATRHLPVIMITSRSTDKHRHEAQAAGVNVYMTKPFAEEELLRHLTTTAR